MAGRKNDARWSPGIVKAADEAKKQAKKLAEEASRLRARIQMKKALPPTEGGSRKPSFRPPIEKDSYRPPIKDRPAQNKNPGNIRPYESPMGPLTKRAELKSFEKGALDAIKTGRKAYKKGGSIGSHVKTYKKGGYVEAK